MQTIQELEKEIKLMRIEWVLNYCANNGIIVSSIEQEDLMEIYSIILFKEELKKER